MMVKLTYATVAFTPSPPKRLMIITFPTANPSLPTSEIPGSGGQHTKIQIHTKTAPRPFFYLVCDFESFLNPSNTVDDDEEDDVDASSGRIRTIDEHKVSGFCCYRVTTYLKYQTPPTLYSGADDVIDVFYQHVFNELNTINWIVSDNVEMLPFTPEQEAEFEAATICGNCENRLPSTTTRCGTIATYRENSSSPAATITTYN